MNNKNNLYKKEKIFIFGYFGWHNAGDDAIGVAAIRELAKRKPFAEFLISVNGEYFLSKNKFSHNVQGINFNVLSVLKAIKDSDIFIITGGTHFQDQDEFIFRSFKIFLFFQLLVMYAYILNKAPIILGHGIGPIRYKWSKLSLMVILKHSRIITVRDMDSYDLVKTLGFENKCLLGFDIASLLLETIPESMKQNNNDPIIGMSILPVYSIYSKTPDKDISLVDVFSRTICQILKLNNNLKIKLFAFRSGERHSDVKIIEDISKKLKGYSKRVDVAVYNGDIMEFIDQINECNAMVSMRYHSLLFAYILKKSIVAIEYQGKCRSLAQEIGLEEGALLSLNDISCNTLLDAINKVLNNTDKCTNRRSVEKSLSMAKEMFSVVGLGSVNRK
jgi:polysaccharide pyruvyl transferase WcaK-like protein